MIALVRGRILSRTAGGDGALRVVVDVGGVGYLLVVPAGGDTLPPRGSEVTLHTSLQVREDAMTLYGFATPQARDLFETLLQASGVGPRIALAALATHPPAALAHAIAEGDVDALVLVPGIGKKVAQRVVLELKEKLGGLPQDEPVVTTTVDATARGEARLALLELGYTPGEAHEALRAVDDGSDDPAALVRAALRALAEAGR